MNILKTTLIISISLLLLASVLFAIGGTLAVAFFPQHFTTVFISSILIALLSIPFTFTSLISAYRARFIGLGYVLFSILISCFIAGAGWFIIPFILNRDLKSLGVPAETSTL
jgi:hypothetical protein